MSTPRKHIEEIRIARGIGRDGELGINGLDLEGSLRLFSSELYKTSTHFILELVQNADDNTYASGKTPTLKFKVMSDDRSMLVTCNETGFRKANVDALCGINRSTKSNIKKGNQEVGEKRVDYIGEKGIGWKSIFKVATAVMICSNGYEFELNKTRPLGIITPEWKKFPKEHLEPGCTHFLIEFDDNAPVQKIVDELNSLEPATLLFLRRLEIICFQFTKTATSRTMSRKTMKRCGGEGMQLTESWTSGKDEDVTMKVETSYVVVRKTIHDMPLEVKRPDITTSEITLAFLLTGDNQPKPEVQKAYAFLPIRSYGFKFLIQADFLLTASREDIDDSKDWNTALRRGIAQAFHTAVGRFNGKADTTLKYTWPQYLPNSDTWGYLTSTSQEIATLLRRSAILVSDSGTYRSPDALMYVARQFRRSNGSLPFNEPSNRAETLHAKYMYTNMETLGVRSMNSTSFLEHLRAFMFNHDEDFKKKDNSWHSDTAKILMEQCTREDLKTLPLIPLRDGNWTCLNREIPTYFEDSNQNLKVPEAINIRIIDPKASADATRRKLFRDHGGAKSLDIDAICSLIVQAHKTSGSRATRDLVEQTKFLFNAFHSADSMFRVRADDIIFATEKYDPTTKVYSHYAPLKGNKLYMNAPDGFPAVTSYFKDAKVSFYRIHKLYTDPDESIDHLKWTVWLQKHFEIMTIPRIEEGVYVTPEFAAILKSSPYVALTILKNHQKTYASISGVGEKYGNLSTRTISLLKETVVRCRGGQMLKLSQTYIPERFPHSNRDIVDILPALNIENPTDSNWAFLFTFGVGTKPDALFYVHYLQQMQKLKDAEQTNDLKDIYAAIAAHSLTGTALKILRDSPLIWARKGEVYKWLSPGECLWSAPSCIKKMAVLHRDYPDHRILFAETLRVRDASISDIIEELCSLERKEKSSLAILEYLLEINARISDRVDYPLLQDAKIMPVLPLQETRKNIQFLSIHDEWFIANSKLMFDVFQGKAPMLHLDLAQIKSIDKIIARFNLQSKMISGLLKEESRWEGSVTLSKEMTSWLQSKARYLAWLVPKDFREKSREILESVEVLGVSRIKVKRWIPKQRGVSKDYIGKEDTGDIVFSTPSDSKLQIYVHHDCMGSPNQLPLWDIAGRLSDLLNITDPKHQNLVEKILSCENHGVILRSMQKHGFEDVGLELDADIPMGSADDSGMNEDPRGEDPMSDVESAPHPNLDVTPRRPQQQLEPDSTSTLPSFMRGSRRVTSPERDLPQNSPGSPCPPSRPRRRWNEATSLSSGFRDKNLFSNHGFDSSESRVRTRTYNSAKANGTPSFIRLGNNNFVDVRNAFDIAEDEQIGFEGERYVFEMLKAFLGSSMITEECWTSHLRTRADHRPFEGDEAEHADFTYSDKNGKLTRTWISQFYPASSAWADLAPTYHIEVKTTTEDSDQPFFISANQFRLARRWTHPKDEKPKHVYMIVRVSQIRSEPEHTVYVDPWSLFLRDELAFEPSGPFIVLS